MEICKIARAHVKGAAQFYRTERSLARLKSLRQNTARYSVSHKCRRSSVCCFFRPLEHRSKLLIAGEPDAISREAKSPIETFVVSPKRSESLITFSILRRTTWI